MLLYGSDIAFVLFFCYVYKYVLLDSNFAGCGWLGLMGLGSETSSSVMGGQGASILFSRDHALAGALCIVHCGFIL